MRPQLLEPVFAATAGNATKTYTNDTGEAVEILFGNVVLVTDATVANRLVSLLAKNSAGNLLTEVRAGAAVTASLTAAISYHSATNRETALVNNSLQVPLPDKFVIPPAGTLTVSVAAGVAGDSFSGRFLARKLT